MLSEDRSPDSGGNQYTCKSQVYNITSVGLPPLRCGKTGRGGDEGASTETPKASRLEGVGKLGRGIPLSIRLKGLGERRKLPQWGPGRRPGKL